MQEELLVYFLNYEVRICVFQFVPEGSDMKNRSSSDLA